MLPDVPTIAETVPGYEARTWAEVGVPKGTPVEIIARLNHEINAGLANPTIKSRLAEIGTIPMIFTAADFGACVAAESEKWAADTQPLLARTVEPGTVSALGAKKKPRPRPGSHASRVLRLS
jgi:tripartite-type tricarboxylate transporter receptor subunit TctC